MIRKQVEFLQKSRKRKYLTESNNKLDDDDSGQDDNVEVQPGMIPAQDDDEEEMKCKDVHWTDTASDKDSSARSETVTPKVPLNLDWTSQVHQLLYGRHYSKPENFFRDASSYTIQVSYEFDADIIECCLILDSKLRLRRTNERFGRKYE
ncbi:hypothetical protein GPALN_003421 [Globodera pallida]|nr:hypothetical protein GPALN_003421 [Globodera pallida]